MQIQLRYKDRDLLLVNSKDRPELLSVSYSDFVRINGVEYKVSQRYFNLDEDTLYLLVG